jgi:ribulose-phosphate 3-epimerase
MEPISFTIVNPDKYLEKFAELGSGVLTVHAEACTHLHRTVQKIKSLKMKAGVAINPHTPVSFLESIINDIDLVCLMSVNPGFGGQSFIESSIQKIKSVRALIDSSKSDIRLEVDGGVKIDNISRIAKAGADTFVAGSAIFGSDDYFKTITAMRSQIELGLK